MGLFDGCLLVSDVDGTLTEGDFIHPYSASRIADFISEGGYFSVATGRCALALSFVRENIAFNAPAVLLNGGQIFDYATGKIVSSFSFEKTAREKLYEAISQREPSIGVEIYCGTKVFIPAPTRELEIHDMYEGFSPEPTPENIADLDWNKVSFTFDEPSLLPVFYDRLQSLDIAGCSIIKTTASLKDGNHFYMEAVPSGTDKGKALKILAESLSVKHTFAIGDFYNDLPMILAAECGAATAGSPEDVRKQADFVSCSARDGAVGNFIDHIEERMRTNDRK